MVYITRNIFEKLLKAVRHPEVTEQFIYGNDDHFLLQTHNIIPDYFSTHFGGNRPYQLTVRNTGSDKNYDVHAPMVMSKSRFENTVAVLDWNKAYGYCIKTVYCKGKPANNFYQYEDLKIRKPMKAVDIERVVSGRLWFSIDDRALNEDMISVLEKLYKQPSRWER